MGYFIAANGVDMLKILLLTEYDYALLALFLSNPN